MDVLSHSMLGALLARPWIDRVGLIGLRRWYFPLSRLWAAANVSSGDVARFCEEADAGWSPALPDRLVAPLLGRHLRLQAAAQTARSAWEDALFGDPEPSGQRLRRLDEQRRVAATRHLASRLSFYPLLFPRRPPPARWQIDQPAEVTADLARALAEPNVLYDVPIDPGTVAVSRSTPKGDVREYWLRAATPFPRLRRRRGSEVLYARLVEPADGNAEATIIFGGGLCQEVELVNVTGDAAARLAATGWRVIEPVSPYHGLRAMPGRYGGEPFFAAGPSSALDLIAGQAVEAALLIAWCRGRFSGKVALVGISMTSFAAQQVASRCHLWPSQARPDGVMLISHSGRLDQATLTGRLALDLGLDRALAQAGWSGQRLADLCRLVDPLDEPALEPSRIVSVLGEADEWVPYRDGLAIAHRWGLPPANMFSYRVGHLGMPFQLGRDGSSIERLRQVLRGM